MVCYYHNDTEASCTCNMCGVSLCSNCATAADEHILCPDCFQNYQRKYADDLKKQKRIALKDIILSVIYLIIAGYCAYVGWTLASIEGGTLYTIFGLSFAGLPGCITTWIYKVKHQSDAARAADAIYSINKGCLGYIIEFLFMGILGNIRTVYTIISIPTNFVIYINAKKQLSKIK